MNLEQIRKEKKLGIRFVVLKIEKRDDVETRILNDTVTGVCYLQTTYSNGPGGGISVTPMYKSDGSLYCVKLPE